jgi:hypothetical protein
MPNTKEISGFKVQYLNLGLSLAFGRLAFRISTGVCRTMAGQHQARATS